MTKIAGIVVYRPNTSRLMKNINAILGYVDELIIYLNSSCEMLINNEKIKFLGDRTNKGMSYALNEIMNQADIDGAEWCLLLDQDSIVLNDFFLCYEEGVDLENVAILTPTITYIDRKDNYDNSYINEVRTGITSGSYNKISVWKELGGFREDFFIDYVDWEFFARIRECGYKAYIIPSAKLSHELGRVTYHSLMGIRVQTYNHNSFRKYYITRNSFAIHRLYPDWNEFRFPMLRSVKRFIIVLLFEDKKMEKVISMIKGYISYRRFYGSSYN